MARKSSSAPLIVLLVVLALLGLAANLMVFFDLPWLRGPGSQLSVESVDGSPPVVPSSATAALREARFLIGVGLPG